MRSEGNQHHLNTLLDLMQNDSFNFTDYYLKNYHTIINLIAAMNANSSVLNSSEMFSHHVNCGGSLDSLAQDYAHNCHPYFAIVVCVFGTVANILNIVVLTRKDMATAPINRILTALAVADMLLMMEYIPYAYYYYMVLLKKKDFPYPGAVYMMFHAHITQILHTMSICLTLTLAIWRYLAIGYPEKNHILCSERRCTMAITLGYVLPVILCAPTYATITITSQDIEEEDVTYTLYHTGLNEAFASSSALLTLNFWMYAVVIKLIPCCILTVISCWLIRTLFQAKKRKQVLRGYDTHPLAGAPRRGASKAERRADRTTKMLVAVLVLFLLTEFPQGIFALLIGFQGKDLFLGCYQVYGEIMDILALCNGAINFILYCCMNRMFRATFGQLFKHKILAQLANSLHTDIHSTTDANDGTNATEL